MSVTQGTINTQETAKKGPDDETVVKLILLVGSVVVSPITALSAALVYFLFSYGKIKRSVIAVFSAPIFIGVAFFFKPAVNSFLASWTKTFPAITSERIEVTPGVTSMLLQQFWLALPVGILVGLGFATWRWFTRARWKEIEFRRTPWEILHYKKTVKQIQNDESSPVDGMTLGVNADGDKVVQTNDEASAHTIIIGGSGSGKSRTAMMRIRDQIKRGEGCIIIDLKADPEFTNLAKIYADRYGRKFQHFTLQDVTKPYTGPAEEGNAHYDPLAQGDPTRRADMVLELREWDAASDFFKKMTQSYLQLMFTVLVNNPKPGISTLADAIDLMSPKYLQERARPLAGDPRFATFVRSIDALNDEKLSSNVRDNLQTNRSQLEIFLQSVAGPWLMLDTKNNNNISILDAAYNGDVVFFSLDSQSYQGLSSHLANLIIQDLKTISAELLHNPADKPLNVFIDEFSAIGSDNIIGLINKARAAKMSITVATQTLSDLESKTRDLAMQLFGILSSFIIHRANTEADAKVYAGLSGVTTVNKIRQSVDYSQNIFGGIGSGIGTGAASVEEVEQWRIMPADIQNLNRGEFFYINAEKHRVEKVRCIIEDLANPEKGGTHLAIESSKAATPEVESSTVNNPVTFSEPIVNREFTASGLNLTKESPMARKKKDTQFDSVDAAPASNPFNEVKDMEKVPLNYDLLRSFFNHKEDVDEQEEEDIADGVATVHRRPQEVAEQPKKTFPNAFPSNSSKLPARPTTAVPARPVRPTRPGKPPVASPSTPKKNEFDF